MGSILDIKRRLEKHREELQHERQPVPQEEEAPADLNDRRIEEEQPAGERSYSRRSEARRDLGMDELLRETKNKEQRHIEELRDEIANLDDLKDLLNQMIKEGEEHITELESKLNKYNR